jgi:GntR family transcriptional repressor for pyruvate dehydrogenase complex
MNTFSPVKTSTLSEVVAQQIFDQIAQGSLKIGDRLPTEVELMRQFKVGRSTIREAIQSLTLMGIAVTRRSAGTFISGNYINYLSERFKLALILSPKEFQHIEEVRQGLEIQTVTLAAERSSPEQKRDLEDLVTLMEKNLEDPIISADLDFKFHIMIAQASNNPILINLAMSVKSLIGDYIKFGDVDATYLKLDYQEHKNILNAIQSGSSQRAAQAMREHLNSSSKQHHELIQQHQNDRTPRGRNRHDG